MTDYRCPRAAANLRKLRRQSVTRLSLGAHPEICTFAGLTMTNNRAATLMQILLTALSLAAANTGCGRAPSRAPDDLGALHLALVLPGGEVVNTVNYEISGNGIVPMTGVIDVSAPGTTSATALITDLPAGSYTVVMTAMTTNGVGCSGSGQFTVVAQQTVVANVILQCSVTNHTGAIAVYGGIDQCPFITSLSATSLGAQVGDAVIVGVAATDLDVGDNISYSWTPTSSAVATVNRPGAASTTVTCNSPGTITLSIAVSDGTCGDALADVIPITCFPTLAGVAGAGGTP
jgi:hypothetical protein